MRKILSLMVAMAALLASGHAQVIPSAQLTYDWPQVSAIGQQGSYLTFDNRNVGRPGTYTIDFSVTGTAPGACTFNAQGSSDGTNWYPLDGGSAVSCTATNSESITGKPVRFLRINVVSYTAGDGTTKVIFHYTGGIS